MFLTSKLLQQHNACQQGIKYFNRFYPNGAEAIDVINGRHISKDFLHWGRENLAFTEEEFKAYCDVCHIFNSEEFWYSEYISKSLRIIHSNHIKNSKNIFYCYEIENSSDITYSDSVTNSRQIFNSSMVNDSIKVYHGDNISNSNNVCNSFSIVCSNNVIFSNNIFNSSEIIESENVTNSYFCQSCNNIKNCMFCLGINDAEYYIFNKYVGEERFNYFVQQYKNYMQYILSFIKEWPEDILVPKDLEINQRFDLWYNIITNRFWKWVKTLPNFSSKIMYSITSFSEFLKK